MLAFSHCFDSGEGAHGSVATPSLEWIDGGSSSDAGETHGVFAFATMSIDVGNGSGTGAADAMFC
jgi:hypothetical protein